MALTVLKACSSLTPSEQEESASLIPSDKIPGDFAIWGHVALKRKY